MTATCIGRHDDDPPLTTHGMLCHRCHGRLLRSLETIRVEICHKLDLITPGNGTGGTCHTKPGSRSPARDELIAALDVRSKQTRDLVPVAAVVDTWCRILVEERRLSTAPSDTVEAVGLLERHADWIAAQPYADEILIELGDAAMQMRRIADDLPPRPLGTCPDVDPAGQSDRCGGPLRWVDGYVQCARCHGRWDVNSLIYLGRVSPLNVWDTVPVIAAMLDAPERTVRRWVVAGKVRKNAFGQVRHGDVWRILAARSEPPAAQTTEGSSTT